MITIIVIITLVLLLLILFIISILFLYQKRQITYQKDIESITADYEKNLLKTQLEIQEQIFQTISRDIHDNINLLLTLAKLNLNTLDLNDKEKSSVQVNSSINYISTAISDLTNISRSMSSDLITEQGLISALNEETEKLRKLTRFNIQFDVNGNPIFMDAQKELFIFRIVQESFNNILKHAHAKHVNLCLYYKKNGVDITITDDGIGFAIPNDQGKISTKLTSGLRNMQKRANLLNGNCHIESTPGNGTIINISIPF